MIYNIAIIGAGQLGSRHLQGLKKAKLKMAIYLLDNSTDALKVSKERYDQIDGNPLIQSMDYITDINQLPMILDLVIIATGSLPRARITIDLLKIKRVKNIVFEKFLFPSLSEYKLIEELLENNSVKAWVNCPRRMYPFYHKMKEFLSEADIVKFSVCGGNWGLGCNSIHFIDIFSWLIGKQYYKIDLVGLDQNIDESKRSGYIEFTGLVSGSFSPNHTFSLKSENSTSIPPEVIIHTDKYHIILNEVRGTLSIEDKDGFKQEENIQVLFQSQLTDLFAEQILLTGYTNLTTFSESSQLHVQFLEPLVNFYNNITRNNGDSCPIT